MKAGMTIVMVCCMLQWAFTQPKPVIKKIDGPFEQLKSDSLMIDLQKIQLQPTQKDAGLSGIYHPAHLPYLPQDSVMAWVDPQYVYLHWSAKKEATGFNVYRKAEGDKKYTKLNTSLLTWPTNQGTAYNELVKMMPVKTYPNEWVHIKQITDNALKKSKTGFKPDENFPTFVGLTDLARQAYYDLGCLYHQVAVLIGYGTLDSKYASGKTYTYQVKYIKSDQSEVKLGEIKVDTGIIKKLSKPTGLKAESGDHEVLLIWDNPVGSEKNNGYHVYRSTNKTGPFTSITNPVMAKVSAHLNGDTLLLPQYGYLDTMVVNYTSYYYRVASRDPVGKTSPPSATVHAKPRDLTPPVMPEKLTCSVLNKTSLYLTWEYVVENIKGWDEQVKGYRIFRYDTYETAVYDTGSSLKYSIGFVKEPKKYAIHDTIRTFTDKNVLEEKTYWYRVVCEDTAGNVSNKTAAKKGILPDITPPEPPPRGSISAVGSEESIEIYWGTPDTTKKINKDLFGFQVYRGICDSVWVPPKPDIKGYWKQLPLHFLDDIPGKTKTSYKDKNVPKESPICYRYAIKSYDKAQNLSVMSDSVCQRLQDTTPPDTPVITALQARNRAIKIEAVGAPIQDMKGFRIKRALKKDGPFQTIYSDPKAESVTCKDIPASIDSVKAWKVNLLSYLDKSVKPGTIYWYKVQAFDHNNNSSEFSPPISTYTYEIRKLTKPKNLKANLEKDRETCIVKLVWDSGIAKVSKDFLGYAVFRSLEKDSKYIQLGSLLKKNSYQDRSVAPGLTYWYKVQAFDSKGDRSELSDAINITISQQ